MKEIKLGALELIREGFGCNKAVLDGLQDGWMCKKKGEVQEEDFTLFF